MRIAHVANFYGPTSGGLRTTMHELGRRYLERGHEYVMVVPGAADADEDTPFGRRVSVRAPVLPLSGGYRLITRVGDVRDALVGFQPDILEVSDRTTLRGLGSWAGDRGVPSVFFAHERADGVLAAQVPSWLGRASIRALADWHNRGTARRFTTVIATTGFAAQEFERIGVPATLVPLGVDLDQFSPDRRDPALRAQYAAPDQALVVMASRLSPEKRPDLAIEAVRVLVARGRRVQLVSAGGGSWAERMRALATDLPVTFVGFVDGRERFASLLATADAVVAPGPIETFGLAALEALASGTPVVINAGSALPSVVGDAGMAAAGTGDDFADAIEQVLDWPEAARRAEARARAETMPWSATVNALLDLYGTATGAPSASPSIRAHGA